MENSGGEGTRNLDERLFIVTVKKQTELKTFTDFKLCKLKSIGWGGGVTIAIYYCYKFIIATKNN